jgi:hypothetical protein
MPFDCVPSGFRSPFGVPHKPRYSCDERAIRGHVDFQHQRGLRGALDIRRVFLMVSGLVHSQSASPKLYAVIFDLTVNSAGKVETHKVAKAIDPSTYTTDAVNVPLSDANRSESLNCSRPLSRSY